MAKETINKSAVVKIFDLIYREFKRWHAINDERYVLKNENDPQVGPSKYTAKITDGILYIMEETIE